MSEKLYRRNEDGMMESVRSDVPEARGKAAALDAWLAQGGTPFRASGRYKKGPFKGKNYDEAKAMFERMWATAPDEVKQKYADRTTGKQTDLAPSEIPTVKGPMQRPSTNASLNAAKPGERPAQQAQRMQASRAGDERETPAQRAAHGAEETGEYNRPMTKPAPATASVSPAEKYQTADNGDGAMRAAIAMQAENLKADAVANPPDDVEERRRTGPGGMYSAADRQAAREKAASVIATRDAAPQAPVNIPNSGTGGYGPPVNIPSSIAIDRVRADQSVAARESERVAGLAAQRSREDAAVDAQRAAAGLPAINRGAASPISNPMLSVGQVVNPSPAPVTAAPPVSAQQVAPMPPPQVVTSAQPTAAGPPRTAMNAPDLTGNAGKQPRINPATQLPFGYRPGDDVAPAQAQAAADSIRRQEQAPMVRPPVARPVPVNAPPQAMAPRQTGPLARPDGYQAPSQQQDWAREDRDAKARAAALAKTAAQGKADQAAGIWSPPEVPGTNRRVVATRPLNRPVPALAR